MISSEKYRATMQITLSDIFQDFNDSRKEMLMKRVKLALEDLQIRMRNEVESNNLANLQLLLKKQQALKKMEERVSQITQQIEEKRERDVYLSSKATELQTDLNKKTELLRISQQKVKSLTEAIHNMQQEIATKDEQLSRLDKQQSLAQKQIQEIEMEKQKHESTIKKLRDTFIHKVEETEYIMKIKEQKLTQSYHQSMNTLEVRNIREREKQEIEIKLKNARVEKKNQKIQVALNAQNPPASSRLSNYQSTARAPPRTREDKQVQTEPTQEKKIVEFIDNSPPKKEEKLEEIRLIYSATPPKLEILQEREQQKYDEQLKVESPRIVKLYTAEIAVIEVQTEPVTFKPPTPLRFSQSLQAYTDEEDDTITQLKSELQSLRQQYSRMEELHENRYWEIVKIYEERPSQQGDLKEIQMLKIRVSELSLQLQKKQKQVLNERDLLCRINHDLQHTQNNNLLKRFNVKLGESTTKRPVKLNKTCSNFFNHQPKRVHTHFSQHIDSPDNEESQGHNYATQILLLHKDEDIITVTKSKNALKYSQHRRHSLKSETAYSEVRKYKPKIMQDYQKYSKLKSASYFQ